MEKLKKSVCETFREYLWPVYSHEHKKLFPILALFLLISFVYNLLRNIKISLIVTLKESGAHTVPFLKIGVVLPGAILLTYIFTKLANKYHREKVFYIMLVGFLLYFTFFMLVFYPQKELLELNKVVLFLKQYLFRTEGFSGLMATIKYWNFSLFYVISELWSSIILSMLFWGFTNEITSVDEAKRFYAIFSIAANSSGIFTGVFANLINKLTLLNMPLYANEDQWLFYQLIDKIINKLTLPHIPLYANEDQWLFYQLLTVLIIGIIIIFLFYYLTHHILKIKHTFINTQTSKFANKLSLRECFFYLKKSRYLSLIVIIVVAYNIVYNLSDVVWTYRVNLVYAKGKDFNTFMNNVVIITGFVAVFFGLFLSGNIIRKAGWTIAALVTPIVWLLTGILFFGGILVEKISFMDIFVTYISNPANLILLLGTIQICLGRGCKYTIFDATKEMTFIPLPKKEQRKSKAIVDGISSRFGKSCGSLIIIGLLIVTGNIAATIPYITLIVIVITVFWLLAILNLGKMVKEKFTAQEQPNKPVMISKVVPSDNHNGISNNQPISNPDY